MLSNANSMVVTEVAEEDPPPLEPIPFFSTPSQFTKKPTQVKTEIHTSPKKKNFNNCKKSEGYLGLKKGFFSFNKETDISKKSVHPEVQPTKKKDGLQTLQPTTRPHVLEEVQQAMLQHDPKFQAASFLKSLEDAPELTQWLHTHEVWIDQVSQGGPKAMQAWSQASPYDQQMFFMCMERLPGTTTTSTDLKKASQTLHSVVTEPEVQEAMLDPVIHSYLQCLKQGIPFTNMNSLRQPEIQRKLHLLVQKGVIELQS